MMRADSTTLRPAKPIPHVRTYIYGRPTDPTCAPFGKALRERKEFRQFKDTALPYSPGSWWPQVSVAPEPSCTFPVRPPDIASGSPPASSILLRWTSRRAFENGTVRIYCTTHGGGILVDHTLAPSRKSVDPSNCDLYWLDTGGGAIMPGVVGHTRNVTPSLVRAREGNANCRCNSRSPFCV